MPITSEIEDRLAQVLCKDFTSLFVSLFVVIKSILNSNIDQLTQYIYEVVVRGDIGLHKDKMVVLSSYSCEDDAKKCMLGLLESGRFAAIRKRKMFQE